MSLTHTGPTSVEALVAAAAATGLHLMTNQQELDETGLDFRVLHAVDEQGVSWIVRTPRRPDALDAAHGEARVLRLVGPRLPVAVPDWRVQTDAVIAYPRLQGVPAMVMGEQGVTWNVIDPAAPGGPFMDSCAAFLAALQRIDVAEAATASVTMSSIAAARASMAEAMQKTRGVLAPSDAVWARWQRWLENDVLWPNHVALVHGDFHPGHMLLGPAGNITGVIDWTEAQVTDPSMDFAMFSGCFGEGALRELLPRVERSGGTVWPGLAEHAIERWAAFAAVAAEWALRTDDAAVMDHARAQLQTIAS